MCRPGYAHRVPQAMNPMSPRSRACAARHHDEAAGRPPSPARTALARHYENIGRWLGGGSPSASAAHAKSDGQPVLFLAITGAIGIALVAGVWLSRAGMAGP